MTPPATLQTHLSVFTSWPRNGEVMVASTHTHTPIAVRSRQAGCCMSDVHSGGVNVLLGSSDTWWAAPVICKDAGCSTSPTRWPKALWWPAKILQDTLHGEPWCYQDETVSSSQGFNWRWI